MRASTQILNVQMLRALAAVMVVAGHAGEEMRVIAAAGGRSALSMNGLNWGWGVDVFFVISGFIMIATSADRFGKPGAAREFFVRRLIRIVPLYWLTTTLLLVGAFISARYLNVPVGEWPHIAASYLFIPDLRPSGEVRPVLALGWTLNYEMFFYVFFALAMLAPLRRGVLALFALFGLLAAIGAFGPFGQTQIDFWTSPLLLEFLLGVAIGLGSRNGWQVSGAAAFAMFVAGFALYVFLGPAWRLDEIIPQFLRAGVPAALLVAAGVFGPDAPRARLWAAVGIIGDASYALYLVHPFAIRPLRHFWIESMGFAPPALYFAVALSCALAAALALHFLVETPLTRALNNFRAQRRQQRLGSGAMQAHAAE